MTVETKEKLEQALANYGIKGEWVNKDEYGFSRNFRFVLNNIEYLIEWYCNYSSITVGNAEIYFDSIVYSGHCKRGKWLEFTFRGQKHGLMLNAEETNQTEC